KTISKDPDTQEYNIKGIYGMNGSGKSGIVTSVEILRNLIIDSGYLNNPIVQKNLDEIINKRTGQLFIEVDYLVKAGEVFMLFRYSVTLARGATGKYIISHEYLSTKKATSKSETMDTIFEVSDGEIVSIYGEKEHDKLSEVILNKTMNLLTTASMCALFYEKFLVPVINDHKEQVNILWDSMCMLYIFGKKLYVYLDQSDDHREYVARNSVECYDDSEKYKVEIDSLMMNYFLKMDNECLDVISVTGNIVSKEMYKYFEKTIDKLYEFLYIFKSDLQGIEIDKKENCNLWICDLVMIYESYKIHAEYESTGIKKLIRLFAYLNEMVQGGIVFIDEFDSNLHDVYLCALLEYLMEYGEGQLCFTTHNVGPMDVLKQHKKSIDFLSEDHKIYSWTKSGNYSPSRLYRNGMIEGSPFNVDSIDFIGVFGSGREDE
ncbi:MAG: ATP/GTP-binding protein, partial [Floccifex porci]|uniref:AAA family ATPase n=1 Tax=Floccifex porci TaxID=2606629 RepID=UPI003F0393EB